MPLIVEERKAHFSYQLRGRKPDAVTEKPARLYDVIMIHRRFAYAALTLGGGLFFLGVGARTLSARGAEATGAVTVGDPKNPGALAQAIDAAYKGGARQIAIRRGVYLLPRTGKPTFVLDGWKDATLSAQGVTLISSENAWGKDLFDLRHCANVTLAGPTLSQTGGTACQGRVIAIGKAPDGNAYADWRLDAGYPAPAADATKFPSGANLIDAKTRLLKNGVGDFYDLKMASIGVGVFRVQFKQPMLPFVVGDWIVGRQGEAGFKVFLDGCTGCTVRDIVMMRNGFAPLREDGGGGNRILACRWANGPRPAGATEEPLVTNAADGFHSTGANPGPDVEGCAFEGVFLDDCIAIHGDFQKIKGASTGTTIVVENGNAHLTPDEPARIASNKGLFAEATVTAIKDNGDKTSTVTLDHPVTITADDTRIFNPLHCGAGYKIVGCTLGETRSRGLLLKGDNGLVKGNTFFDCGMSAVSLGPEFYWNEAGYVRHVTIEGNTFRGCGKAGYGGAAIFIHGDGAMGNENITVKDNIFIGNFLGDVQSEWATALTFSGNTLAGGGAAVKTKPAALTFADCDGVTLTDNRITNAASYGSPAIVIGVNVGQVHGDDALAAHAP